MNFVNVSIGKKNQIFQVETLTELKEKVNAYMNTKEAKFLRLEDLVEIEDEETFKELLLVNKKLGTNLSLILQEENSTIFLEDEEGNSYQKKDNNNYSDFFNMKKNAIVRKLDEQKKEKEALKKNIKQVEEDTILINKSDKQRLDMIENLYKKMLQQTITVDHKNLSKLETNSKKFKIEENENEKFINRLENVEKIDICFLVDCKSGMSRYIKELDLSINKIIEEISKKFKKFKIRFGFIGYRIRISFETEYDRFIFIDFIEDIEQFKFLLKKIDCFGRNSLCEDLFGGLNLVCCLDWKNETKILFHMCDAYSHELLFQTIDGVDNFCKGDTDGLKIYHILETIHILKINYFFLSINETKTKMIEEFNKILSEICKNNETTQVKIIRFESYEDLSKAISYSIETAQAQMTKSLLETKAKKERRLNENIDWNNMSLFKKFHADYLTVRKLNDLFQIKLDKVILDKTECEILISEYPFASGELRFAYGALLDLGTKNETIHLRCVVKESAFLDPNLNTKKFYEETLHVQSISGFLANEFNKISKCKQKLRFLKVDLIRIHENGLFFSIEEHVEGRFVKWMNNEGITNNNEYVDLLNAFSHWTFEFTNEYLIVTDLQGFSYKNNEFILTDPAIISADDKTRFGKTNLGQKGIQSFLSNHKCNEICKFLNLKT